MTTPDTISALWDQLTNQLVFLEKRYVFRHDGLALHPSELHLLLAIRDEPAANATKLAAHLGITKGAVSQLLKRLDAKGLIEKTVDPSQKNEVTSAFTPAGGKMIAAFLKSRQTQQRRFAAYLAGLGAADRKAIAAFLAHMQTWLPQAR